MLPSIENGISPAAIAIRFAGLSAFAGYPPYLAAIFNEWLDTIDAPLSPNLSPGGYHLSDKIVDTIFYGIWLLVSIANYKWFTPYLIVAYLYRLIGIVLFVATGDRKYLILFPNFFLLWYIYLYFIDHYNITYQPSVMVLLVVAKLVHEYVLHGVTAPWRMELDETWSPNYTLIIGWAIVLFMLYTTNSNMTRMITVPVFAIFSLYFCGELRSPQPLASHSEVL